MSLLAKSLFFSALGNLLEAGFTPVRALGDGMPLPCRGTSRKMIRYIEGGSTLWEAMQKCHFPKMEVALTRAGEMAGTLPLTCAMLRDYYEEKRILRSKYISALAYPLCVYFLSVCVSGLLGALGQAGGNDWRKVILGLSYPFLIFLAWKLLAPVFHSRPVAAIVDLLPFFGGMQNQLETSRFLTCFGKALEAGIGVDEAIRLAGDVCTTALYRSRFRRLAALQDELHVPFTVVAPDFISWPSEVMAMLQVGELTGQFPEKADKAARLLAERHKGRVFALVKVVGALVYICAVIRVAYLVITFYSGLYSSVL